MKWNDSLDMAMLITWIPYLDVYIILSQANGVFGTLREGAFKRRAFINKRLVTFVDLA